MAHECRFRVYYEDTDLAGVMYYANHLKFMERGRSEAVAAAGVDQAAMLEEHGLVFVVRRVEIDYLAPARFGEEVTVTTTLEKLGGAGVEMLQTLSVGDRPVAAARVTLACMGREGRIARIPADTRQQLAVLATA